MSAQYPQATDVIAPHLGLAWGPASEPVRNPEPATCALRHVILERARQVELEKWNAAHDDNHEPGELARAAACYAATAFGPVSENQLPTVDGDGEPGSEPVLWPWDSDWWKPGRARRDLVKAGALILAELERLDREEAAKPAARSTVTQAADDAALLVAARRVEQALGSGYLVDLAGRLGEQKP